MRSILRFEFAFAVLVFAISVCPSTFAAVTTLHHFAGGGNDGAQPQAAPILSGGALYGTTVAGGDAEGGTIYKSDLDGTNFTLLREFAFDSGTDPYAALTPLGTTLFGTTKSGGAGFGGTVFKVEANGSGFDVLHEFELAGDDGEGSLASLTLSGSTLYGTTEFGGSFGLGTVFKVNVDGSGYQRLYDFVGGADDGSHPSTKLAISGSTLYGTTLAGGNTDAGTIFRINLDGSGFQLLHEFADASSNGEAPDGSLVLDGSTLYGTTEFGGGHGAGTVYKINTNGSGFMVLHHFSAEEGPAFPATGLTQNGSVLYGTTGGGGATNDGTIFTINKNGSGFNVLHEFSTDDGVIPSELTLSGSRLYGTTAFGGDFGLGTLFYYSIGGLGPSSGDYNGDGVVGPADLSVWKSDFGSTSSLAADGNGNGIVDAADYTVWLDSLGRGSTLGNAAAVPEPAAISLVLVAVVIAASPRARR